METRQLGETGHESSVVTLGAIALDSLTQQGANRLVELAIDRGVNHVDVAPTYGDAEVKLAPTLGKYRDQLFLGCKTKARTREGAREELDRSLERLDVDHIDLYQFHAVTQRDELDTIVGPGGALETFREAQADGIIDHIGLTSHGSPSIILDAIDRIDDLASVMFPMNYVVLGKSDAEHDYRAVLDRATDEGLGALGIKAFAKEPWPAESELPEGERPYETWYEPFDTQAEIDDCLNFAISQGMTSITNAGDPKLVAMILDAAERFEPLSAAEQNALTERGESRSSPVPRQ